MLTIFAPAKGMILAAFALVIVDLITGIIASHKTGKPITSSGLQRTIVKLFVYETAIMLAFIVQVYMMADIPVANIVSSFVGITELKSCYENIDLIAGENLLKRIISRFGSTNED